MSTERTQPKTLPIQLKIPRLKIGIIEKKMKEEIDLNESDLLRKSGHPQSPTDFSSFSQTSKTLRSINRINREHLKDFLSADRKRNLIIAKTCRDVSHLKDKHQIIKNIVKLPDLSGGKAATQVLPISPEHLKKFIYSVEKLGLPAASPRGIMTGLGCSKEKCLEKVVSTNVNNVSFQESLEQFKLKIKTDPTNVTAPKTPQPKFLDSILAEKKTVEKEDPFVYLGSPTGRQEVQNLKEWFAYMQENHLNKLLDQKLLSEIGEDEKADKFEIADVILKTGLREIVRQVSVYCVERGELLSIIVERYLDYWKICCSLLEDDIKRLKEEYTKEIERLTANGKEKDKAYNAKILELGKENAIILAASNSKDIEISRLRENIRRFKAERAYRMKKDFEHYTSAIRKFQEELKESDLNPENVKTGKSKVFIMQKLDEAQRIVSKLKLKKEYNDALTIVDSEENVAWIDQDMIDDDIEEPYKDEEVQVEFVKETEEKQTMTFWYVLDKSMETDEIDLGYRTDSHEILVLGDENNYSFVADGQENHSDSVMLDELKPNIETGNTEAEDSQDSSASSSSLIKTKKTKKKKISIIIDKDTLNVLSSKTQPYIRTGHERRSLSVIPSNPPNPGNDNIIQVDTSHDISIKSRETPSRGSVYPGKKNWNSEKRKRKNRESQTEGLLEEEMKNKEIMELMINDREEYLNAVQKEIMLQKNEINKLKLEADRYRTFIHEISQQNPEEAKHLYEKIEKDVEKLKEKGYVPSDVDFNAWKAGYYTGFDNGHFEGKILGEELGFERGMLESGLNPRLNSSTLDISNSTEGNEAPKDILKVKERKTKRRPSIMITDEGDGRKAKRTVTKIMEFNFQKREPKTQPEKKIHMGPKLLQHFLHKSMDYVKNFGKISRKMLVKSISFIYSCAIAKYKTGELVDSLAEFAYDELFSKYGLKKVADKKYLEIISTLLKYPDSIKISTFTRLLGIGNKIGLTDYAKPKLSLMFYISSIVIILKSKVGIIVGFDDTSEYQMIPTIRATECIREKFNDLVSQNQIQRIISLVEKQSQPDPKKVNKNGVIDQDILLDIMLSEYEKYEAGIVSALNVVFDGFSIISKVVYINKLDLVLITRYISPHKFSLLVSKDENNKEIFTPAFISLCQNDDEEEEDEIHIEKVINFCIEKAICSPADLENYLGGEVTKNRLFNFIDQSKGENTDILMKILKSKSSSEMPNSFERNWLERMQYFTDQIDQKQPKALYCSWKLITDELSRLNNELPKL
ncbi:unnamed protein product [Blepharisma stoltei]|uniref:Uncharacterized protein n=1 Tax=Blepharisma stoltei TaxID=1481888 RepID=A0AAU9JUT6_9CILI|nr:unnamed protein product [Blepharisma stoltei]